MYADDTKIKLADGTEKSIRLLNVGDVVALYGTEEVATITSIDEQYQNTYAVVCNNNGIKKALYCTLDQHLMSNTGDVVETGSIRIGSALADAGKVFGLVESGERRTFSISLDKEGYIYANGFVGD